MPTLRMLGVHPEVCARLMVQPKRFVVPAANNNKNNNNDTTEDVPPATATKKRRHRMPTPKDILTCPIDSLRMMNKSMTQAIPIPLDQAFRLRREIAQALTKYNNIQTGNESFAESEVIYSEEEFFQSKTPDEPLMKRPRHDYNPEYISTGCSNLDQLLLMKNLDHHPKESTADSNSLHQGGIPLGFITHISGPPVSGKTQFVCHMAARCSIIGKETWMLCSGSRGPYAARLYQLIDAAFIGSQAKDPEQRRQQQKQRALLLKRIILKQFANEFDILAALTQLESVLQGKNRMQHDLRGSSQIKPSLLVIDSVYLSTFDRTLALRIENQVKIIAQRYCLGVIVIGSAHDSTITTPARQLDKSSNKRRPRMPLPFGTGDVQLTFVQFGRVDGSNYRNRGKVEKKELSFVFRAITGAQVGTRSCLLNVTAQGIVPV